MSIIGSVGLAVGRALIPDLINRAARGRGETLERVAQGVTSVVLDATGLQANTPADQVLAALDADPVAYARVKEAAASLAIAEIDAEIRAAQLVVQDRASARETYATTKNGTVNRLAYIAAGFALVSVLAVVGMAVAEVQIDPAFIALLGGVIGSSLGYLSQVMNFYFGSSEGSRTKTDIMSDRLPHERHR